MELRDTQPLEDATPVVPETAGTIPSEERRVATGEGRNRSGRDRPAPSREAPGTGAGDQTPTTETYPHAPAGSAGHP